MLLHVRNVAGLLESFHQTGGENGIGLSLPRDRVYGQYVAYLFKWIKQHLRIKSFFGTSENAVKTQVWIAVSVYVLVAIVKKRLNIKASLYSILQILSLTVFETIPIDQLLARCDQNMKDHEPDNQLNLFAEFPGH